MENGNNRTHRKMKQMQAPTVAERKPKFDNGGAINSKVELMLAAPVAFTTNHKVAKKISAFLVESLNDIPQSTY